MALKHIGRVAKTGKKVAVAYRVIPGEPDKCLIVPTEGLDAADHDTLMKLVESNTAQNSYELAEAMHRATLTDGSNMLVSFMRYGKLVKVSTSSIDMIPDTKSSINLAELNKIVAEQKGVTIADLALKDASGNTVQPKESVSTEQAVAGYTGITSDNNVLSDEQLAAQFRSQADALYKEAKQLREQAEELVPTKKARAKTSAEKI
jgi:hypothetical protein